MPRVSLNVSRDDIKDLIRQLPPEDLLAVWEAIEGRAETLGFMRLAETGFAEWNDEAEALSDEG